MIQLKMASNNPFSLFLSLFLCIVIFEAVQGGNHCYKWKECPNSNGRSKVTDIKIGNGGHDCEEGVIILPKGTNVSLEIDFTSNYDTTKTTSVCHGVINGIPVPFPLSVKDACTQMSPSCPIVHGKDYNFVTQFEIKNIYPSIRLVVKWEEQADDDEDLLCVEIPAVIQ